MAIYLMNERVAIKEAIANGLSYPNENQRQNYAKAVLAKIDANQRAARLLDPETCTPEEVAKALEYSRWTPPSCLHCDAKGVPLAHFTYSQSYEDVDVDLCADCLKAALKVLE